jgi:hypothetical protein
MQYFDGTRTLSAHLDYFEHQGAFFVHHNLFGYILQMSRDVLDFLEFFHGHARAQAQVQARFGAEMPDEQLLNYLNVFEAQSCLVEDPAEEAARALRMVPVLARWTLAHAPPSGPVRLYFARREDEPVEVIQLSEWASALWRRIDGEATLEELVAAVAADEGAPSPPIGAPAEAAVALLAQLAHHRYQALKLSPRPMSAFRAHTSRRALPPYLSSSMPYRCVTDEIRGITLAEGAPAEVVEVEEHPEVTLAHLLRRPHPALGGRTYGGALLNLARQRGALQDEARLLVIGAADPALARNLWDELQAQDPALASRAQLTLLASPDADPDALQQALAGLPARVLTGDAEALSKVEGLQGPFDLILCNEFMARLDTVLLHKIPSLGSLGEDGEEEEEDDDAAAHAGAQHQRKRDLFMGEGESVSYVFRYGLRFEDVDGEFFFNLGAAKLIEGAARLLATPGLVMLVEYGDLFRYPEPSETGGDGVQFSVHFKPLMQVGQELGLEPEFDWLVNRLEMDRGMQMLSSTRRHARALARLLEDHGLALDDIGWSRELLAEALGEALPLEQVQGLEFRSLNDRVMGIVPSSLKILTLARGAQGAQAPVEL